MSAASDNERQLTGYLLGALPADEEEALDRRLFADDDFHAEVQAAADDLIHDYLSGTLSNEDRGRFEKRLLGSARMRERVAFIRDLGRAIERQPPVAIPARRRLFRWRGVGAGLAIGLVAAAALMVVVLRGVAGPREIPSTRGPEIAVSLSGGPDAQAVELPAGVEVVRFVVPVGAARSPTFDVVLSDQGGEAIHRAQDLQPDSSGAIAIAVPAARLPPSGYVLSVRGEVLRGPSPEPPYAASYRLLLSRASPPQRQSP